MTATYRRRIVDDELAERLVYSGGVLVEGPKACGKTATASQLAASQVRLDVDDEARQALAVDPAILLEGSTPRLIDEWQVEPAIWNHVRHAIDERQKFGQFILAGSAIPADDVTRHSGVGRISRLRMRPMSLFESGHSDGAISLGALIEGEAVPSRVSNLRLDDIAERISIGGWPGLQDLPVDNAERAVADYLEEICRTDIHEVDGVRRDPARVRRFLSSIARNVSTHAAVTTLARDTAVDGEQLDRATLGRYLDALERLMVVEDQAGWSPRLRSSHAIRSRPKRHFVDPSLAVAALGANAKRVRSDLTLMGHLFEGLAVRDLRVYAQASRAEVLQYRDSDGLEVDAVVTQADGRWSAFEFKLGAGQIDAAAAQLRRFADRVDTGAVGAPTALAVIAATGYGYLRDDGVHVVPIGVLGP